MIKMFFQTSPLREADGKENSVSLGILPVELLLMIVDQLDVMDQVCLKNTNRFRLIGPRWMVTDAGNGL